MVAFRITRGTACVYNVYEIAERVDIEVAEKLVRSGARVQLKARRRQPPDFGLDPPPLEFTKTCLPFKIGKHETDRLIALTVWPGGVVTVEHRISLDGLTDEELIELGVMLASDKQLELDAAEQVGVICKDLGPALHEPIDSGLKEDYAVFVIRELAEPISAQGLLDAHGTILATLLHQEKLSAKLSLATVEDALSSRFSWSESDLTLVSWNAAVVFDEDRDGMIQLLLEFVQVQLLELRFLDDLIDKHLKLANQIFAAHERETVRAAKHPARARVRHTLAQLDFLHPDKIEQQAAELAILLVEAQTLRTTIEHSINVLGDPTYSKLHALCAARFKFDTILKTISDKTSLLDKIYSQIQSRRDHSKGIFLELVVIALILTEVVMAFIGH